MPFVTKIQQKLPPTTLLLKYICNFLHFVIGIIFTYVFHMFKFFKVFFFKFFKLSLNLNLIKYT